MSWSPWATLAVVVAATALATEIARRLLRSRAHSARLPFLYSTLRRGTRPAFAATLLLAVQAALPRGQVHGSARTALDYGVACAAIAAVAWLLLAAGAVVTDVVQARLAPALGQRDNRRARRERTQLLVVHRVYVVLVVVVSVAAALLTFPDVRALGASLLASAGILAAVLGVAGKSTLGNLVAGIQIAFTDLVRLDDVVVVQDEWGWVDEIGLTSVVVRTWDMRRVVLPTSWFTENPFQNWTRDEARVLGTVFLRVDWRVPVSEVRAEVWRLLDSNPRWDRRDWVVQVTELQPDHVEVRCLMSSVDAPTNFDLRCDVREALLLFVRDRYPEALARTRVEATLTGRPDGVPDPWQVPGGDAD